MLLLTVFAALAVSLASAQTILSCSFPNSVVSFSIFRGALNTTTGLADHDETHALRMTPPVGLAFNAEPHPTRGLLFASDMNGSVAIHDGGSGRRLVHDGATLNDHPRAHPRYPDLVAFSSTRNTRWDRLSWNVILLVNLTDTDSTAAPTWLSPKDVVGGDYSPAWSTDGKWLAIATGSGEAGMTDIALLRVEVTPGVAPYARVLNRTLLVRNGGWPTFWTSTVSTPKVIFHRAVGSTIEGPWGVFVVDMISHEESQLINGNALTPYVVGNHMLYAFSNNASFRQIAWFNLVTQQTAVLTTAPTHHYSPSGYLNGSSLIVFYHKCRGGALPNMRRFTSVEPGVTDTAFVVGDFPTMSPNGRIITMIGVPRQQFVHITFFDADGSNPRTVYEGPAFATAWTNSGDRLAFSCGPAFSNSNDGSVGVCAFPVDPVTGAVGTLLNLTARNPLHNQAFPAYSPNGQRYAYRTSDPLLVHLDPVYNGSYAGVYRLAMGATNGSVAPWALTAMETVNGSIGDTHTHWIADGSLIVFASDRGHFQRLSIWTVRPDGSNLTEIYDNGAVSVHPTSYRNSVTNATRIVFTSTVAGYSMEEISWPFGFVFQAELFSMNTDGTDLRRLTHDAGENANAFASATATLPPGDLPGLGPDANCDYRDSTRPIDPFGAAVENRESNIVSPFARFFPHGFFSSEDHGNNKRMRPLGGARGGCPMSECFVAMDVGGTSLKCAVFRRSSDDGTLLVRDGSFFTAPSELRSSPETFSDTFKSLIRRATVESVTAIGISTAGIVDYAGSRVTAGVAYLAPMKDPHFRERLSKEFGGCCVTLINDADAAMLGAATRGYLSGGGHGVFGTLVIGTGVGLSLCKNGRAWQPDRKLALLGACIASPLDGATWDEVCSATKAATRASDGRLSTLFTEPAGDAYLTCLAALITNAAILYHVDTLLLGGGLVDGCGGFDLAGALTPRLGARTDYYTPPTVRVLAEGNALPLLGAAVLAAGTHAAAPSRFQGDFASVESEIPPPVGVRLEQLSAKEVVGMCLRGDGASLDTQTDAIAAVAVAVSVALQTAGSGRLIYVGCGTSGRLASMDAVELFCTFGVPRHRALALISGGCAEAAMSIEDSFEEDASAVPDMILLRPTPSDVVVGISVSGTAYYVRSALAFGKSCGVATVVMISASSETLLPFATHHIRLGSGSELITGSTRMRGGTATKIAINAISTTAMILCGKVVGTDMVDLACWNAKLVVRAQRILARLLGVGPEEAILLLAAHDFQLAVAIKSKK